LEAAVEAVDASGGSILLHDPSARQLWFRHVMGTDEQGRATPEGFGLYGVAIGDDEGIAGQVFTSQEPQINNDVSENPQHAKRIDADFQYETRNLCTVPLKFPGGAPIGVMQVVNKRGGDFTEEDLTVLGIVASISAMSAQNAELALQSRKSAALDYLGRVVFDLKNKISHITTPAETLAEETQGDLLSCAQIVAGGVQDLQRYADFMGDVVTGKPVAPQMEENDLVEIVDRQVSLLDGEQTREQGVTLIRQYDKQQPILFRFDSFLVERAAFNLVNNAVTAMVSGGTVTITLREADDFAIIEVHNTGIGLPQYALNRILNGNPAGTSSSTGLSTTIIREVVETHHGRFEGESGEESGTTFRICLPLLQTLTEEGATD
jgi:signal transduction histidine kinase